MNRLDLIKTLNAVGKPPQTWDSTDGTSVLVLPHGGRILGLFAPGASENFFWTHPALFGKETARAFFSGTQWHNSGGERTWLAPEVDFFYPNFPDMSTYWQQRELDPGSYGASSKDGALNWTSYARLNQYRTKRTIDLRITKSLAPALNPLRYDRSEEDSSIQYAGFTLRTTLQLMDTDAPAQVGLWQLTQLPHGGDMLVPTFFRSEPKVYMGTIGREDLIVKDHLIRYRMRAAGEHKIGVRATAVMGRIGYLYKAGNETSLVIRNFSVNPSGEYIDVPASEIVNLGFAFQACNVNSALGAFSEMEYHVPATGSPERRARSEDQSQLWAFRGTEPVIRSVARRLLSAEIE
jgi:hypothetical protein